MKNNPNQTNQDFITKSTNTMKESISNIESNPDFCLKSHIRIRESNPTSYLYKFQQTPFLSFCLIVLFVGLIIFFINEIVIADSKLRPILSMLIAIPCVMGIIWYLLDIYHYHILDKRNTLNLSDENIEWKQSKKHNKFYKIDKLLHDIAVGYFPALFIALFSNALYCNEAKVEAYSGYLFALLLLVYRISPNNLAYKIFLVRNGTDSLGGVLVCHPFKQCGFYHYGDCIIFEGARIVKVTNYFECEITTSDSYRIAKNGKVFCYAKLVFNLHSIAYERDFLKIYVENTKNALLQTNTQSFQNFKIVFESLENKSLGKLIGEYNPIGYDGTIDPYINLKRIEQQRKDKNGKLQQ